MAVLLNRTALLLMAASWFSACQSGEFAGGTGKKPAVDDRDETGTDKDGDLLGNKAPGQTGTASTFPTGTSTNTVINPGISTATDNGVSTMPSLFDTLVGILQQDTNVNIVQPNDNQIVVGQNQWFHVGDGQMNQTTCQDQLGQKVLDGTKFFFEFQVLDPNVALEIRMDVCGVDYEQVNIASVRDGYGNQMASQVIPVNSMALTFPGVNLQPGNYVITVEAMPNMVNMGDMDDYLVGRVSVRVLNADGVSPRRIRPGRVGAQ